MLLEIPGLLTQAQIAKIEETLGHGQFVDGRNTAGSAAKRVKHNEEMNIDPQRKDHLNRLLVSALANNATFSSAVFPQKMADPIFARYFPGMTYGDHVDDPIMGRTGPRFRTDVSMTIFLRDPASYDGGELVVRTTFGEKRVKLAAGDAVIYPSTTLHRVDEVTRGERLVALFWIQSQIRDAAQRELLYELNLAREHLLESAPEQEHTKLVDKSYANLIRMWADV